MSYQPTEFYMRILITNYYLINYAGSEINTLELCLALRSLGIQSDVATFFYGNPMKEHFENSGIKVLQLFNNNLDLGNYDLLWTHHNYTLDHLIFGGSLLSKTKIIFSSLGSFEPLEAPPYYHNELNIILSNSGGNTCELVKQGVERNKIIYFPNCAPTDYFNIVPKIVPQNLNKIAIISNHIPKELQDFSKLAGSARFCVEHIGLNGITKLVDANLLKEYDLVISIGKTVQYCLALRIPVYCYDHFGGPGYLNQDNIESAGYFNFSGRGINRKLTGKELFDDIITNYEKSCGNVDFLFRYSYENFNLEKNVKKILRLVNSSNAISLSQIKNKYSLVDRRHQGFLREQERIKDLYSQLNNTQKENIRVQQAVERPSEEKAGLRREIERLREDNVGLRQEVMFYASSKSWWYTRPFRKIMKLIRGINR